MLKGLRKEFQKLIGKEEVVMNTVEQNTPQAKTDEVVVDAQAGQLEDQAKAFAEQADQLTTALASLQEVKSQLEAAVAAKDALLAKVAEDANKARMSVITKAIGEAKAPALFEATKGLGEAEFQVLVGALAGSVDAEAKSELFKDVGADAEVDVSQVVVNAEEAATQKLLDAKYKK